MQRRSTVGVRNPLLLCVLILGLMTALYVLPGQFRSEANSQKQKGLFVRTESHEEGLENYDIREQKGDDVNDALVRYRQAAGKDSAIVADIREDFVRGEEALKQRVPSLKVEYNLDIRVPEVIAPDVKQGRNFLTGANSGSRIEALRNFAKQNNELIGVNDAQVDGLQVTADYTNPDGNLSFTHLEQRINNVPVFRGEIKAGFTKNGEMIRVINNLAPGLDYESVSTDFGSPVEAVKAAARHINYEVKTPDVTRNDAASTDLKTVFGEGDWATTAEKIYFPTEPGVAAPAYRVVIWQPVNAYMIIVDAHTGTMLWRKNATEDQTQSATYNVYANSNAMINAADSSNPSTPGLVNPTLGTQGARISRTSVTRIGNEAPYTFNNNGWITDGQNLLDGNAVEAGVDRDTTNGVDAAGIPTGSPNRVFNFPFNPGNPVDNTGDNPTPNGTGCVAAPPAYTDYQKAAATQMFLVMNLYHDELYRLGFTEQAFNFQTDNFGRGGTGNDRVSAEGQDCSGTNNANFSTLPDGTRGRMQMFLWTGPTPDYDGTIDGDVIIHEVTHGTSNRLHGNASGLSTNMARGMGEGWSDFYAHAMLSEPTDPANGIYTTGGYATYLIAAGFTANYYYGIRRFPKALMAFTGPNGKPHNPLTFRHLNSNCNTEIGTPTAIGTISAYPRGPIGVTQCDQVHNAGEIWSSALWEVRAKFVQRLGWAAGNRKALQLITDGMKLAPLGPTFLQERDAILAAAQASAAAPEAAVDVTDVWEGFRIRGMGFFASITTASPAVVVESFDSPNVSMVNPFSVSDSTGDGDGFPEPTETVQLSIAVSNPTGATINNVQVSVAGGGTANYGNIAAGATVTNTIAYTIPGTAVCGSLHQVSITVSSSVATNQPVTREFRLGAPVGGAPATFTSTTAVTIPDVGTSTPYGTTINVTGLSGTKLIKLEITGVTHTFPGDLDFLLVGPGGTTKYIGLSDSGGSGDVSNLTFTLADAAAAQPSTTQWVAGNFRPYNAGANDAFPAPAPSAPYTNAAPGGTDTFTSVFGTTGANLNGTWALYVVDDAAGDAGTMAGWKLTFEANDYDCTVGPVVPTIKSRADFDGDGRTDLSVFRPSEGNWYLNRSMAGFTALNWGLATDTAVPADYDGDGKADVAVWRAGTWFVLQSSNSALAAYPWGSAGDIVVPGDYNGDNKADAAVFRPSTNVWYILNSGVGATPSIVGFGAAGDVPVRGDYDGDAKTDIAIFRAGQWWVLKSTGGVSVTTFGLGTDKPVPADYDGDNKDDVAVYRNGVWYALRSTNGAVDIISFGLATDVPVPGDYDGDGRDDQAIYRAGTWWIRASQSGGVSAQAFGLASDVPAPARYIP